MAELKVSNLIIRFALPLVFALSFGLSRQLAHKPIGFGTFIFVATGACALSLTAIRMSPSNPLTLLAAIVTSIGFLGAGALIRTGERIHGFTSAAQIWIFAVVGMVIGVGEYWIGAIVCGLVWLVEEIDRRLERGGIGAYQKQITITAKPTVSIADLEVIAFAVRRFELRAVNTDRGRGVTVATYSVQLTRQEVDGLADRRTRR